VAQPAQKQSETDTEAKTPLPLEYEQIASLASALWQARGCPEGSPEEDRLTAEQELTVYVDCGR
jgi:hypothetical protein